MTGKGETHRRYKVHGDGAETLHQGLASIGMPEFRRSEAVAIVREVVEANGATGLRWYKPANTDEICCYWDGCDTNVMWATRSEVHVHAAKGIQRPARAFDWSKDGGAYVGWLLPGATAGVGGGAKPKPVAEVVCPVTFMLQPVGSVCPDCETVHA